MARHQELSVDRLKVSKIDFIDGAAAITDTGGGVLEYGSSSDKVTSATANMRFVNMYFNSTATSGDNRGMYLRTYFSGASGGGDSARIFATVNNVAAGTVHGAHISCNFGTSGTVTGQATGVRSTLHIADAALSGGTYSAAISEIYADGSSSDISGTTTHAIHRFIVAGNATGLDTVQNLFSIEGIKTGTGATDMLKTDQHASTATDGLRILIDGTPYWILLSSS